MRRSVTKHTLRGIASILILAVILLLGPVGVLIAEDRMASNWRTANRDSAGIAPTPAEEPGAVIQVYAARAYSWRGAFAVHSWIAIKHPNAPQYQTHHVIGWRSNNKVVSRYDIPDRHWFGSQPEILVDLRGAEAEAIIAKVEDAILRYPYADRYTIWPGPNSNTFVAWVAREVPDLRLEMPPHAIGKDYLGKTRIADTAPSGTGVQVSLFGLLGFVVAMDEGIELNILGLTFGIDPMDLNLKLPGIGRIGPQPAPYSGLYTQPSGG